MFNRKNGKQENTTAVCTHSIVSVPTACMHIKLIQNNSDEVVQGSCMHACIYCVLN